MHESRTIIGEEKLLLANVSAVQAAGKINQTLDELQELEALRQDWDQLLEAQ